MDLNHVKNHEAGGRIAKTSFVGKNAFLEIPVDIADNVTFYGGSSIGAYSYINVGSVVFGNVKIGRFCSIGRGVELGLAQHPVEYLSTHPFQVANSLFTRNKIYNSIKRVPWQFHKETIIGNDVWIGSKASIVSGVKIGNGAIVAAGAVVSCDVPDYAIVGGVPAKIIRLRFRSEIIEKLLKLAWWNLPLEKINDLPFDNIDQCIETLERQSSVSSINH